MHHGAGGRRGARRRFGAQDQVPHRPGALVTQFGNQAGSGKYGGRYGAPSHGIHIKSQTLSENAKSTGRFTDLVDHVLLQWTSRMELITERAAAPSGVSPILRYLPLAAVLALVAALYGAVLADLASDWWTDPAASYGMLVPAVALWVAWLGQREIASLPAARDARGLWLAAFGCVLLLMGELSAEFFLQRISFVVVLAAIVWVFWGQARLRRLGFVFVLLATMVPLPAIVYNAIAAPLQLAASDIATTVAQALGVSVFRDGNIIHLANTSLGVEEACSGLRSLSAMVVASLLLGFVEQMSRVGRILLCVASIPLAIAINVLRVAATAVLADYQVDYALGFYHMFTGWLVFLAGFGTLWAGARLSTRLGGHAR
jgi:exosortase